MIEVTSEAISDIDYDDRRKALTVTFRTGRCYVYFDVPRKVYDDFVASDSKGGFLNAHIRDRYRFTELDDHAPDRDDAEDDA